ncbi:hypothetical protein HU200_013336 [Digitaria exilis]|uniref:Uncharacterized protein n=1 Tax=Digitaria exilis TaxID=1010633 RepID=A0A835KL37_9POAL|nr:hypothetical protein HU200_013336 [Digitaria exilis]
MVETTCESSVGEMAHRGSSISLAAATSRGIHDSWVFQMQIQMVEASRGLPGWKEMYFSEGTRIIDAAEGMVVVSPEKETWLYSVDLETMELKREYERKKYIGPAYPSALSSSPPLSLSSLPPALQPPSLSLHDNRRPARGQGAPLTSEVGDGTGRRTFLPRSQD